MPVNPLAATIDTRIGSLIEFNRRRQDEAISRVNIPKIRPTITISREFGCEGYQVSIRLQELLEKKSGEKWLLLDKCLLEEVARNNNLSADILNRLGQKSSFLNDILATFSSNWKSDKEHFELLCEYLISLAGEGNVIIIGRGAAYITQTMRNCYHFRLFAAEKFKIDFIRKSMDVPEETALKTIQQHQKARDRFITEFIDRNANDLTPYHLIFNNGLSNSEKIAQTIADFIPCS